MMNVTFNLSGDDLLAKFARPANAVTVELESILIDEKKSEIARDIEAV